MSKLSEKKKIYQRGVLVNFKYVLEGFVGDKFITNIVCWAIIRIKLIFPHYILSFFRVLINNLINFKIFSLFQKFMHTVCKKKLQK